MHPKALNITHMYQVFLVLQIYATGSKTARVGAHVRAVRHAWGGGGGWGGVGMMTFLALAHMVDATQVMGWGGVGLG